MNRNFHAICSHCLLGYEDREEYQPVRRVSVDPNNEIESRCDWCDETGFDTLFVLGE